MKTKREIYLKPLTLREQVAMEQGICAGSMVIKDAKNIGATGHQDGFDKTYDSTKKDEDNPFSVGDWN